MDETTPPPPPAEEDRPLFPPPSTPNNTSPAVSNAPRSEPTSPANPASPVRKKPRVFIELSPFPESKRALYRPLEEAMLNRTVDEVIGEYRQGKTHFYFAREKGGIAYKFPAQSFEKEHGELVDAFHTAREEPDFKFKDFDPAGRYIHPLSKIHPGKDNPSAASSSRSSAGAEYLPDSEEEAEYQNGADESDAYASPPRRATRQNLPYSPRKSRSQRIIVDTESERESSARPATRSTRRSTRVTLKMGSDYAESGNEEEDDEEEYSVEQRPSARSSKKTKTPKFPPPSYGNVRSIEAIEHDDYPSDKENRSLREHRGICEKCHLVPANQLLLTMKKGKKRKRSASADDFDYSDDEERYKDLGGWVRCLKCPVSCHWKCLAGTQRDEILKAARAKDKRDWETEGNDPDDLKRRKSLQVEETTEYICASCSKGGVCLGCTEDIAPAGDLNIKPADANGDVEMGEPSDAAPPVPDMSMSRQLHFRCLTCKRMAHYEHLEHPPSLPDNAKLSKIANYYQYQTSWLCHDCASYQYTLDKIIAWRPYPANAKESLKSTPHYKDQLPREYLVKWIDRSYRRLSWVPHMWLVSTNPAKLKNFLAGGTKVELLKEVEEDARMETSDSPFEICAADESRSSSSKPTAEYGPLDALPDAERRIQPAWKTVDRVLDVLLWVKPEKKKGNGKARRKSTVVESDVEMDEADEPTVPLELEATFEHGEEPDSEHTLRPADYENHVDKELDEDDIDKVVWVFTKWGDLGYDEASWDSPPRPGEKGYDAFVTAFKRYIQSRQVMIPIPDKKFLATFDKRPKGEFRRKHALKDPAGLELGQDPSLKLMPFQVDGFNWLCDNWWNHQPCILADDMGLGKTVQMSTFLGTIITKWKAAPVLVVVPNSTITNWVREFERWAPNLRVVPYYGEKKARDIIKEFELFHPKAAKGHTPAKFHVLITTYEAAINPKDFGVIFKKQPRWEALVIDEGQRLKSDSSLLFKKLNELNSVHRVIMTGTPLNNNMRELFNLMNFLDPEEWNDLEALEREHENLNEEMIKQLHQRLRPYFLRRIKSEVLDLPAKNEVIIPVSMAPLQRQVYRSILSHNLDLLKGLTQPNKRGGTKGKLSNILMHLRKCLQHPYLHSEDIEPRNLSPQETHDKLIDASAKLRFLKSLLPKLKARGHRVLLFSQFVLALDVIEDFLRGEGYKFLRLDGNTKGTDRQKSMDEFNKPDSDVFIFLLTTRAGGVGINLFTADTVIIFDPDFNPHQDLQAIARAYRYGQKKTCLVFKLMVKDSAEERIMQIGKKKLVLDHLIVQKMDDDDDSPGENVESILTYGAQALFDADQASKDITYSEHDIDQLIEKTEKEGDGSDAPKEGAAFSFAKVWSADKDQLEDVADEDQVDSWAQTLDAISIEREKERQQEIVVSGRGARRKAADVAKSKITIGTMEGSQGTGGAANHRARSPNSDASVYNASARGSDDEEDDSNGPSSQGEVDEDFRMNIDDDSNMREKKKRKRRSKAEIALANAAAISGANGQHSARLPSAMAPPKDVCGLCGRKHGVKECLMTDKSSNLAEYRLMLIMHADDEPWEERSAAVRAIDELLNERGQLGLIQGQPLHPVRKVVNVPPTYKPKETTEMVAAHYREKQQARAQMPAPTSAKPLLYQQRVSGNEIIRDYSAQGRAALSSSAASAKLVQSKLVPTGRAGGGGGVVVSTPASGSGQSGTARAAMVMSAIPTASASASVAVKMSSVQSSTSAADGEAKKASQETCVVCSSTKAHFLKNCPVVLQGPVKVKEIMNRFQADTSDPRKADALLTLKRIYKKQKKAQEVS